jgi:hypothetical protein
MNTSTPIHEAASALDLDKLLGENVHPAFKAACKAPQFFTARTGRRRQFLSQGDADAYDRGYASFESLSDPPPLDRGPFGDGWFDAFSEDEERATASLEAHESDVCEIDDDEVAR